MARRPCEFLQCAIDFCLLDLHDLSQVSATSTEMKVHVLTSTSLKLLLQRKVEEEENLDAQNRMVDVGFKDMAALKHNLRIALHIYGALHNSRCFACRKIVTKNCTEHDGTLAETKYCTALTEDGVHAAATF